MLTKQLNRHISKNTTWWHLDSKIYPNQYPLAYLAKTQTQTHLTLTRTHFAQTHIIRTQTHKREDNEEDKLTPHTSHHHYRRREGKRREWRNLAPQLAYDFRVLGFYSLVDVQLFTVLNFWFLCPRLWL